MPTVGGVVFALFAWRRAAEAAPRVRRAGRPEALRACPGSSSDSTLRHHPPRRPTLRETKTGGWAHRPRPPPRGRSATRLAGHPPILARLQAEQTRVAAAPHDLFPAARRVARLKTTWAVPARHLQSRPAPATPPSEPSARASAVPWSRGSATSYPSRGNHRPHHPAAGPSTIPAARGAGVEPPSSCGLGLPSAKGTEAGPCLRTSTEEECDARAAVSAMTGHRNRVHVRRWESRASPESFAVRRRSLDHGLPPGEGGAILAGGGAFMGKAMAHSPTGAGQTL